MKKKIIIFKNDRVGDLVHSVPAIKNIISNNQDKEIVIYLSTISKNFYFLFRKDNTKLKVLNYSLTITEKIKIFLYLFKNKIEEIYILSPKNFFFYLPVFFLRIKFFGLCVNGVNGYKRPHTFLRKFLYKLVVNDRETTKKRKSTQLLQYELTNVNKNNNIALNLDLNISKSEKLIKILPTNYVLVHYKKKIFEQLSWSISDLERILNEILKHNFNVVLVKDIEIDENNSIFKNKFKTYDFKTNKFFEKESKIIFLDNVEGIDLYNAIKYSNKVVATHGMMTNLAYLCKKPVLDLYHCVINNKDDYHSYKNAFYEFKPSYPNYDFIIPSNDVEKTIRKMRFSLTKKLNN